jgi:diguanylate cyclase (GGDEF)-like protein/PAS domain S-box-containing protein
MQTMKESELRYHPLFEAPQAGILILDANTGMIEDVNPYLIEMLGYSRKEFIEKKLWEVDAFKDIEASHETFESLQQNEPLHYEDLPLKAKDGRVVEVEFTRNTYLVGNEKVVQCNIRDITERKQSKIDLLKSQARFRQQSVWDQLTGLFNRSYMEETLTRELLRASRKQLSLGLIMVDVDGFRQFNEAHGPAASDAVLNQLGALLLKQVRADDVTSRYGSDEFMIVLPDASRKVTWERAQAICEAAKQFVHQFNGHTFEEVTVSIGIAVYPEDGLTNTPLLRAVDDALYRAKREGRNRVAVANK